MPGLREQMLGLEPGERAAVKSRALAAALETLVRANPWSFRAGDLEITVSEPLAIDGGFECTVAATLSGVPLVLSNPFRFINPPIVVREGEALVEDLPRVLREIIGDAVRTATLPRSVRNRRVLPSGRVL